MSTTYENGQTLHWHSLPTVDVRPVDVYPPAKRHCASKLGELKEILIGLSMMDVGTVCCSFCGFEEKCMTTCP
jgi:hypothetical protein